MNRVDSQPPNSEPINEPIATKQQPSSNNGNSHLNQEIKPPSPITKVNQDTTTEETAIKNTNIATTTTTNSNNNNNNNNNHDNYNDDSETITANAQQPQDDSSSFSTAFTISFDDDSGAKKKFGIRDSIRKFAPPKPQTIENPNRIVSASSKHNQEQALMSIESAPPTFNGATSNSKQTTPTRSNRKSNGGSSSVASSSHGGGRRRANNNTSSNHSSQSIISDSTAYLIDKMLAGPVEPDSVANRVNSQSRKSPSHRGYNAKNSPNKQSRARPKDHHHQHHVVNRHMSDLGLGTQIDLTDYCDDRSDNGTYVVGTDPDVEAARQRIDELFGVAKKLDGRSVENGAGGGSGKILTSTPCNQLKQHTSRSIKRGTDKSQVIGSGIRRSGLSKERQQHIDRLAYRDSNYRSSSVSRSSSSSRQGQKQASSNINTSNHHHQNNRRQTRNLSSERTSKDYLYGSSGGGNTNRNHRRSLSQSSRKSNASGLGHSDEDTRSSRSSMSHAERNCSEGFDEAPKSLDSAQLSTHPNMKFNRAFALRRARLGIETTGLKINTTGATINGHVSNQITSQMNYQQQPQQSESQQKHLSQSFTEQLRKLHQNLSPANETPASSSTESNNPPSRKQSSIQLGALDSLVISAISSLSQKIRNSVCDVLVDQAKKLPSGNETRVVVEEILPQIMVQDNNNKVPTSAEEIDRSLYFDLAKTLRNLKKVEQIVDVISMISKQTPYPAGSNFIE